MKHMKKLIALALVAMTVLAVAVPAMALDGGYNAAADYLSTSTLKRDWNNNQTAVRNLQIMLDAVGIYPGPIDGIYGVRTESAVLTFQQRYDDLSDDGECGRYTKTKLWEVLSFLPVECTPI